MLIDKECPFLGVTSYGRVWREVPESDARSVGFVIPLLIIILIIIIIMYISWAHQRPERSHDTY